MKKTDRKEFTKRTTASFFVIMLFGLLTPSQSFLAAEKQDVSSGEAIEISQAKIDKIEGYIHDQMKRGKIPGLSVVIVNEDQAIYKKGFGFANIEKKQPVTSNTLFELGSNSKAFTALGILLLKEQGRLKPDDQVDKYIPWFKMKYNGKEVSMTIEQLMHHTSGIPFKTIAGIPASDADNALEETVKKLIGKELNHNPGEEFSFATINYDVLGLIIQNISGQPFEDFMKKNILVPLGLSNTYLSRKQAMAYGMASGYKAEFLAAREYKAPIYRGNTPAGYFISNGEDMERWLKIQLGTIDDLPDDFPKEIIKESHQPNEKVIGFRYAKGWFGFRGREIFHSGNNPNFSSFIVLSIPKESKEESQYRPLEEPGKIGIAVLANINSSFVEGIGWGILAVLKKGEMPKQSKDFYIEVDRIASIAIFICFLGFLTLIWFNIGAVNKIFQKAGKFKSTNKNIPVFAAITLVFAGIICLIYNIPILLGYPLPWGVIAVWSPITFVIAAALCGFTVFLFYLHSCLKLFFLKTKPND